MKKMVINFSGKTPQKTDYPGIMEAVGQAVDEKREQILSAKENDRPVTIILPDHGVMAIALTQAVRGLLGRTPYVQSVGGEEIDTESIREAFRESL